MTSAGFYKWRSKYGGMDAALMSRREELETENVRLKKMYAKKQLKAETVREAFEKKWRCHPDTARSSAYAAYETPVPSKGNEKFTRVAFFVISQTESFDSTDNFVVGFDFGIDAHFRRCACRACTSPDRHRGL
ncbi:hypothetical protein BX591_11213 [Paraburkholderia bryophila]|uniref:Transposase n=1 Tax=Paraburkholderia bryophila TaxID=420952 RepID=A0A329BYU4_9BURK|nr:hypothetical protein BX591_11213 [Paraburkholderia bryophila]